MLRITRSTIDETAQMKLEGKLMGPWVDECRSSCAAFTSVGTRVMLDLSDLTFVDAAGIQLLHQLLHQGHGIATCSNYVAELLQLEKPR